jgi:hypothetical protein
MNPSGIYWGLFATLMIPLVGTLQSLHEPFGYYLLGIIRYAHDPRGKNQQNEGKYRVSSVVFLIFFCPERA